ncbi:ABC transporter substrate-binding protein [Ferrigenium kumadai]|nr:ABC transporter substrate binding protein [Ferrigenium kumadai]
MRVLLLLSDNSAPYRSFSQTLSQSLPPSFRFLQMQAGEASSTTGPVDLVVAIGMKATEAALNSSNGPVLGVMIHQRGYESLLESLPPQKAGKETSAIYLNQPWERQLDFLQATLPNHLRVGLLHSPDTHLELPGLRKSFTERGLTLIAQPVRSPDLLFPALDDLLNKTDVLLTIPDNAIYNTSNVRNILLTSYQHKVPLIGISQAYVNAGALCAIFSTPEQLAAQTGAALVYFARNKRLPEPHYPDLYVIALNNQVARSLGINLPSPEEIRERMNKAREGRR